MTQFNSVIIFGGSGFIGAHLAVAMLKQQAVKHIILADHLLPNFANLPTTFKQLFDAGQISFVPVDVREPITGPLPKQVDLIVNLAAVHREPGHERHEYYNTNISGAENICEWARQINCQNIVFTSSIAVYGTKIAGPKTEATVPHPNSPYGVSKLAAEQIHKDWLAEDSARQLLIVRPGVIFGTGEAGNITRMVRAIRNRYFVYFDNQQLIKSGGYVKELANSMLWMMDYQRTHQKSFLLYNFTMHPAATVKQYADAIKQVLGRPEQQIWNIPVSVLLPIASVIGWLSDQLKINQPINSARVKKLQNENNIIAQQLVDLGYPFRYNLLQALQDWQQEHPQDWA